MAARTLIGDFHEAEDAAHEALVSAHRAFGPWLSRILSRAAERRRRALARQVPTEDLSRVPAPSGDRDDRPERVLRETARLPEKYRVLLTLFYIREHSYREVAAITGQSEKRVKSRLFAAREMLRRRLDGWLGEGEAGFSSLEARVASMFRYEPSLPAEVNAWAHVPFEDVVRAVDICRKAGVSEITFVGAPPPGHGK